MFRPVVLSALVVTGLLTPAHTWQGDVYYLPIHEIHNAAAVAEFPGAGYGGTSAYGFLEWHGVSRINWKMQGPGLPPYGSPELFSIEFYDPMIGGNDWQPIEVILKGLEGDQFPMEPAIPWAGQFGTNHQWIASQGSPVTGGTWVGTGPGPQTPDNGKLVWLQENSWLYAKWDLPWDINRAWSYLRVTQVTGPVPEPAALVTICTGLVSFVAMARRKR